MSRNSTTPSRELVINWHITEACNFSCRYCYAKWQADDIGRELIHDRQGTWNMLSAIYDYFSPENLGNPLRKEMAWDSPRLNLAGGEPLLYQQKVIEAIKAARQIGFTVSIITNGSRMDKALAEEMAPHLSVLGVSLDSANEDTNAAIGRIDRHGGLPSLAELGSAIALAKSVNSALKVKLNTVVNALNWYQDMSDLVANLGPVKWKVLRMLPSVTDELAVTEQEFHHFVRRHQSLRQIMCVEDNADMAESYLMIDPHGRFFQNALGRKGYVYSPPILEFGVANAYSHTGMSVLKFASRYSQTSGEEQA